MKEELSQILHRIPSHALSVYLYIDHRSRLDIRVGLTQQEISRTTRLSVGAVREALGWLEQPSYRDAGLTKNDEIAPLIRIEKFKSAHKITMLPPYSDNQEIRFTFEDTDQRRIKTLEDEIRRLAVPQRQTSRLSLYIKGERQQLISEIEGDLGRPLTVEEAYLLGGVTHQFGVERIKSAWRQKASRLDKPVVGIYAMFMNQAFGKSVVSAEEPQEIEYQTYVRDEEIV